MKKIFSVLLALLLIMALIPSTPALAFAVGGPDDQVENEAMKVLNALGIIDGYEDGSFKPEKTVSRAEMAKMLISARGMGDLANGTPSFSDCQKHWAKGYIALASDLGLIDERGNGVFDPDEIVTYEEATAMLLRTLGFTDKSMNGSSSGEQDGEKYKSKALELGLFSEINNVDFSASANRGDIAIMLKADLQQNMVTVDEKTHQVVVTDKKLVDNIASLNTSFEVTVKELGAGHRLDLTPYLYQNLQVYQNDDGKVVQVLKSNSTAYEGNPYTNKNAVIGTITLSFADNTRRDLVLAAEEITAFCNGAERTLTEAAIEANNERAIFVLDDAGKVKAVICEMYSAPTQVAKAYINGKAQFAGYDLPRDKYKKVDLSKVTVVGDATELSDIKVDDIIEVAQAHDKSVMKIVATRNVVEGTVSKIEGNRYYINTTWYSLNNIDAIGLGTAGRFFLDKRGDIAAFRVKGNYGIVQQLGSGKTAAGEDAGGGIAAYPTVKLVDAGGKIRVLELALEQKPNGQGYTAPEGIALTVADGQIVPSLSGAFAEVFSTGHKLVKYYLDAAGRISKLVPVKLDSASMKTSDPAFMAGSNTIMLNLRDGEYSTVTTSELKTEKLSLQYAAESGGWEFVVTNDAKTPAPVMEYGIYVSGTGKSNANGRFVYELTLLSNNGGTLSLQTTENGAFTGIDPTSQNRLVEYTRSEAGEINYLALYSGPVKRSVTPESVSAAYMTFPGDSTGYALAKDCGIFNCGGLDSISPGGISDIQPGEVKKTMDAYIMPNGEIGFIVVAPVYYYYPIYVPTTTTEFGLLTSAGKGEVSILTRDGESSYPYSGAEMEAILPTPIKFTLCDGTVTEIKSWEIANVPGSISAEDKITINPPDTTHKIDGNSSIYYYNGTGYIKADNGVIPQGTAGVVYVFNPGQPPFVVSFVVIEEPPAP